MTEVEREQQHERRMDWAEFAAHVFGQVCGLVTVLVLAVLAKYFVDNGAATQGAAIVTAGAVSIVAVFVTGRLVRLRDMSSNTDESRNAVPPD
jgi:Na+/melibiose symporter-like transporter